MSVQAVGEFQQSENAINESPPARPGRGRSAYTSRGLPVSDRNLQQPPNRYNDRFGDVGTRTEPPHNARGGRGSNHQYRGRFNGRFGNHAGIYSSPGQPPYNHAQHNGNYAQHNGNHTQHNGNHVQHNGNHAQYVDRRGQHHDIRQHNSNRAQRDDKHNTRQPNQPGDHTRIFGMDSFTQNKMMQQIADYKKPEPQRLTSEELSELPRSLYELLREMRDKIARDKISHSEAILYFLGLTCKLGIMAVLDKRAERVSSVPGRIILTRRRSVLLPRELPICYECNGVVVNTLEWKVVSYPPKKLCQLTNPHSFSDAYSEGKYELYEVHDGTMATFYKWGRDWCISTSNGYDVSQLKWMSGKTFADVIFDLFQRLYPDSVRETQMEMTPRGRITFGNLPENYCHTIFFRHHTFHPLEQDPERIWHYGSVKTDLTFPSDLHFDSPFVFPGIPKRNAKILSGSETKSSKTVNLDFEKRELEMSVEQCVNRLFYGYILIPTDRSRNYILFPSALLSSVRNLMYTKVRYEDKPHVSPQFQKIYNFVKAYLNPLTRSECPAIYPEFTEIARRLRVFIDNVSNYVVDKAIIDDLVDGDKDGAAERICNVPGMIGIMGKFMYNDMFRRFPRVMMPQSKKEPTEIKKLTVDAAMDTKHAILYIRLLQDDM